MPYLPCSFLGVFFFSPKVVSCGTDGSILVTDLSTGECTMTLRGHEGIVLAVAFDRSKIISASDDATLRTWVWAARGPKEVRAQTEILRETATVASSR